MFMYVVVMMMMVLLLFMGSLFLTNFNMFVVSLKLSYSSFFFDLDFMFNLWNFLFLMMVLLITISVLFFSFSYMSVYPVQNFISLYLLFVLSMFWLIMNNNFYWMMFGWDGLGVVSFLLIVYYMNYESVTNGLFTIFQNRLGDLFFVIFLIGFFSLHMSLNLVLKFSLIFLIVGAVVKSAQYPFNAWLLAAMSAPTPISSLVHSSTLVVAGVFILLQYSYCFIEFLFFLKFLSLMTLIVSMFGLLNEVDMKKLIAFSTMNHVGLMLFMYSLQLYKITYFHLNIHAMFKSLMFMCFGFSMLASYHSQDKRLVSYLSMNPLIKMIYYFACFCLMGLPFLSGFFSKDFIIEKSMQFSVEMSSIILLLLFLSVSVYYSFKLLSLYKIMYTLLSVEMQYLGLFSLFIMMSVSILIINLFISFVFSISMEIMNFKMMIYLLILIFLFLALYTNMNFKWNSYNKLVNMTELWKFNWYSFDQFFFWSMQMSLNYINYLNNLKLILMMNWWVVVIMIFIY